MKSSYIRLAAFAASLLVASVATVQATTIATWDNWDSTAQTDWTSDHLLYADDSFGTPDSQEGLLYASGGNIYGSFYYTVNDYVNLEITPTIFESDISTVKLEIKHTWNPDTNGPVDLVLSYTTDGINWVDATTPTPIIGGPDDDDLTYDWDLTGLDIIDFRITWKLIPHSTFDEIILTQN
jgi:hypothetical protein